MTTTRFASATKQSTFRSTAPLTNGQLAFHAPSVMAASAHHSRAKAGQSNGRVHRPARALVPLTPAPSGAFKTLEHIMTFKTMQEQEREAYITGHVGMAGLMGQVIDAEAYEVEIEDERSDMQSELAEAERQIESLEALVRELRADQ